MLVRALHAAVLFGLVSAFVGCSEEKRPQPAVTATTSAKICTQPETVVAFKPDVRAVIAASCVDSGCHGSKGKGGDLTTYAKAKAAGDKLVKVVRSKKHQGRRFKKAQVEAVDAWKAAGYPETAATTPAICTGG